MSVVVRFAPSPTGWLHVGTDDTYIALARSTVEPGKRWQPYAGVPGVNHLAYVVDDVETVRKRLDVYVAQTKPLIDYYNNWAKLGDPSTSLHAPQYRRISGLGSVDDIRTRVFDALN